MAPRVNEETGPRRSWAECSTDCQTITALKSLGVGMVLWRHKGGMWLTDEALKLLEMRRQPQNLRDLLRLLPDGSARKLLSAALSSSRRDNSSFEQEIFLRTMSGKARWVRLKAGFFVGGGDSRAQFLGILWDETREHEHEAEMQRSYQQSKKLAERLEHNMLEIHHRVKNSFQIVSSLLNLELRRKESLTRQDVTRVLCYLQGLSMIHDMLTAQAGSAGEESPLSAGQLVDEICRSLRCETISVKEEARFRLSPRVASSLAVIATELVVEAIDREGPREPVRISLLRDGPGRGRLRVERSYSGSDAGGEERALLEFLAHTDLQSEIVRERSGKNMHISVSFPLSAKEQNGEGFRAAG